MIVDGHDDGEAAEPVDAPTRPQKVVRRHEVIHAEKHEIELLHEQDCIRAPQHHTETDAAVGVLAIPHIDDAAPRAGREVLAQSREVGTPIDVLAIDESTLQSIHLAGDDFIDRRQILTHG